MTRPRATNLGYFALFAALTASTTLARPARAAEPGATTGAGAGTENLGSGEVARDRPAAEPALPDPGTRGLLVVTGAAITAAWYGLALGASYGWDDQKWAPPLKVPVVGPFVALRDIGCNGEEGCGNGTIALRAILLSLDGIGQVGGLGVLLESLFVPSASSKAQAKDHPHLRALPIVTARGTVGVGVIGEF